MEWSWSSLVFYGYGSYGQRSCHRFLWALMGLSAFGFIMFMVSSPLLAGDRAETLPSQVIIGGVQDLGGGSSHLVQENEKERETPLMNMMSRLRQQLYAELPKLMAIAEAGAKAKALDLGIDTRQKSLSSDQTLALLLLQIADQMRDLDLEGGAKGVSFSGGRGYLWGVARGWYAFDKDSYSVISNDLGRAQWKIARKIVNEIEVKAKIEQLNDRSCVGEYCTAGLRWLALLATAQAGIDIMGTVLVQGLSAINQDDLVFLIVGPLTILGSIISYGYKYGVPSIMDMEGRYAPLFHHLEAASQIIGLRSFCTEVL